MTKKVNLAPWLLLLLFCVITGYSIAAVYVTGGDTAGFYHTGDQMSFAAETVFLNSENLRYEDNGKKFTVTGVKADITLHSQKKENEWRYLTIGLSDVSPEEIRADFFYYDRGGTYVGADSFVWKEGSRQIRLSAPAFSSVKIVFWNQAGTEFVIDTLRFSTEFQTGRAGEIGTYGILFTLLCILPAVWFYLFCKIQEHPINWYAPVDFLQGFYLALGRAFIRSRKRVLPQKAGAYLRIALMSAIMAVLESAIACGQFADASIHRYLMIFFTVCIAGLALLSMEDELERRNWHNPLVLAWFVFWGMSIISDFIVKKSSSYFGFYGYVMLAVFGFLFFVWGNRKEKHAVLWEICKAVEWTFLFCIGYCLLCRPETAGFRYKGFCNNPNPFGCYLAVVGGVFLCELEYAWRTEKRRIGRQLLYGAGFLVDIFFLWKTQCTTAVFSLLGVTVIWLCCNLWDACSLKKGKRFLATAALLCLLLRPVSEVLQWGILNIPNLCRTTVVYPQEKEFACEEEYRPLAGFIENSFTETVSAAELDSSRIWKKLTMSATLNELLSGRLTCYAEYLRSMNLFGHEKREIVYGVSLNHAHNGFLSYMHMYGVYILLPYVVMQLCGLYYAAVYWRRGRAGSFLAFFPLAVFFIFFLENLADTVDTPFYGFVWFVFLFVEGALFHRIDGEGEHGQNTI